MDGRRTAKGQPTEDCDPRKLQPAAVATAAAEAELVQAESERGDLGELYE